MSDTIVDWSQYPEPWSRIGPAFAAEIRGIATSPAMGDRAQRPLPEIILKLREVMEATGMTSRYVARRLGYHEATLGRWLRGRDRPIAASTANIATFLAQLKEGQDL